MHEKGILNIETMRKDLFPPSGSNGPNDNHV